jgi:copper resistance protein B
MEVVMRHVNFLSTVSILLLIWSQAIFAADTQGSDMSHLSTFHAFKLQTDYGEGRDDFIGRWDLDGWIGSDERKIWLKSEGDNVAGTTERSETWTLLSQNIATFWDAQAGFRYDNKSESTAYFVMGFNGLAPYFFETEAHLFVSDAGDVSARIREENDFLITQKLILKPYGEINLFAQDVPELNVGSGLSNGELGLQLRYEVTRKFAPYVDIRYEKLFGDTASIANTKGERDSDLIGTIGVQLMF